MVTYKKGDLVEWVSKGTKEKPIETRLNRIFKVNRKDVVLVFPDPYGGSPAYGNLNKKYIIKKVRI